jgi:hypothetical protein
MKRVHAYIDEQDGYFAKSSDDLFRLSAELNAARQVDGMD